MSAWKSISRHPRRRTNVKKRPSARERGQEPATVGEGGSIEDVPDREVFRLQAEMREAKRAGAAA
jgi:hypothetical protein